MEQKGRGGRPIERRPAAGTWAAVLVAAREEAGLDRATMARRLGVAPPQVTQWESGAVELGERVVRRYADALGRKVVLRLEPSDEAPS